MFDNLKRKLNKSNYIKEYYITKDKTIKINYFKRDKFKPSYIINPDHIFISNGYSTVIVTDYTAETINPLDITSLYPADLFKTAINSKLINDTFSSLTGKHDFNIYILIACGIIIVMLFYIMYSMGLFSGGA